MANQREESPLQAVIVADSFDSRFQPLTLTRPRALLPLCGNKLIDYTIEFLASNDVKDVYVLCCAFADEIADHLHQSVFNQEMNITTIPSPRCMSTGEAMREIFGKSLIKGDFILVTGDIVSNFKIAPVLEAHKKHVEKDKSAIMTMLLQSAGPNHHMRCGTENELVLALTDDMKISWLSRPEKQGTASIPSSAFQSSQTQVRYDLLNSHIYICTADVPMLFDDNFDYEGIKELIKGVLEGDEITRRSVYGAIVDQDYAARVSNYYAYNAISQDIMKRWTFPLVPDLFSSQSCRHKRHHIYLEDRVVLSRNCVLKSQVLVQAGSVIGSSEGGQTILSNTTVGKECQIGSSCKISNAYIWDNVKIGNNVKLNKAVIGYNATVLDNVVLGEGCVLGDGVVVGPNVEIPAHTKVTLIQPEASWGTDDEDEEESQPTITTLGDKCKGEVLVYQFDEDDEVDDVAQFWNWCKPQLWVDDIEMDDETGSELSNSEDEEDTFVDSDGGDTVDLASGQDSAQQLQQDFNAFYDELLDLLENRISTVDPATVSANDINVEISSLRAAHNMTTAEVGRALAAAIVGSASRLKTAATAKTYIETVVEHLEDILKHYITGQSQQVHLLDAIADVVIAEASQSDADEQSPLLTAFGHILMAYYNEDIAEEDACMKWFETFSQQAETLTQIALVEKARPFIDWLENAEEEESDSE